MSITDELREFIAGADGYELWCPRHKAELTSIADSIDAEHEKAVDIAFANGRTEGIDDGCAYYDTEHTECMVSEEHGWVRGPLDADGVMWHEGDMSDSMWGEIELIMRDVDGYWYIKGHDTSAPWVRADSMRHYHEQTVEDVLEEMCNALNDVRMPLGSGMISEEIIAKYAAKLQLKERE